MDRNKRGELEASSTRRVDIALTSLAARWPISSSVEIWRKDLLAPLVSSRIAWLAGLGIAIVVACHYWALDRVPSGFFVDEAGIAYAAWGISLDGRDEYGAAWPIFFQSFGDWKSPVLIYLVAGAIRLFGPGIVVVRAVPTTLSLLAAILLGVLVFRIFRIRWLAWISFFVAGLTPWLLGIGRIGFEASSLPPLLLLALLFWWKASQDRSLFASLLRAPCLALPPMPTQPLVSSCLCC